jgi:hypothetical protein
MVIETFLEIAVVVVEAADLTVLVVQALPVKVIMGALEILQAALLVVEAAVPEQ